MEVLTAYVRQHAPWRPEETIDKKSEEDSREANETTEVSAPGPDIQAIMTVLRRRTHSFGHGEPEPLDLHETNLRGANLEGADLRGAILMGAILRGAYLVRANLTRADLEEADLEGAILVAADIRGANIAGANLRRTALTQNKLEATIGDKRTRLHPNLKPPEHWGVKTDEQPEGE